MHIGTHAHIVGMPPQVEGQAVFGGVEHLLLDPVQLQSLQEPQGLEEGINEHCIEILTARPCMVENLTTGEVEYDEDV